MNKNISRRIGLLVPVLAALLSSACALPGPVTPGGDQACKGAVPCPSGPERALVLPVVLQGKAVVLDKSDLDYPRADLAGAEKPKGEGGVSRGMVIRVTADFHVWRLWNGPAKLDPSGHTNRMGGWWAYDAPHGDQSGYRRDYEVCRIWNDLTWVAQCTLKAGAVVTIGPGNDVRADVCKKPGEAYPPNERDWQLWVANPWSRGKELECPAETSDYEANPLDISGPTKGTGPK
jgi:hypothetical protein